MQLFNIRDNIYTSLMFSRKFNKTSKDQRLLTCTVAARVWYLEISCPAYEAVRPSPVERLMSSAESFMALKSGWWAAISAAKA